jgi:hypothetical protein
MQIEPPPAISEDASTPELARRRLLKNRRLYLGLSRVLFLNAWQTRGKAQSAQFEALAEQTIHPPFHSVLLAASLLIFIVALYSLTPPSITRGTLKMGSGVFRHLLCCMCRSGAQESIR